MCIHFLALLFTLPSTAFFWLPPGVLGDSVGLTGGARGEGKYRCCSSHSSNRCWPANEWSHRVSYQRCQMVIHAISFHFSTGKRRCIIIKRSKKITMSKCHEKRDSNEKRYLLPFWTRWSPRLLLIPCFSFLISLMIVQERHPIGIQTQIQKVGRSYAELCRQGKKRISSAYPKVGKLEGNFSEL